MAQFPEPAFRPAREDDLDRLVEIHLAAYPDARGADARRRNFTANPFGSFDDLFVAEVDGEVVGHAFLFPMEGWFGGRRVKIGGIASVAVAPEARGRGIARALVRGLHEVSDVRGDAITMLYAFRQGFYASLGYAPVSSRKRLSFDPAAVPEPWRQLARTRVRRGRGDDRARIVHLHERAGERASGWTVRTEALWDRIFARERRQLLVCEDGYVAFAFEQEEAHAPTIAVVEELAAATDDARRVLFGALGALRDQVSEVVIEVDANDPIEHALLDADRRRFGTDAVEHALGEIVAGPMVRIEDVHRAIEARGYAADGSFDVVVADEIAMSVRVDGGRAEVGAARGTSALRAGRASLAAIFYGGLRPSDAARLGLVDADERTLARIDAIVAMPAVAPIDAF
jgi:predicted acetyltransferase